MPPTIDAPIPTISSPSRSYTYEELVQYALTLINEDRAEHNLPPVTLGNNIAAQRHAEDMLKYKYLSHWDVTVSNHICVMCSMAATARLARMLL